MIISNFYFNYTIFNNNCDLKIIVRVKNMSVSKEILEKEIKSVKKQSISKFFDNSNFMKHLNPRTFS